MPDKDCGEAVKISGPAGGRRWHRGRRIVAGVIAGLVACEIVLRLVRFLGMPGSVLFYARQDLYWKLLPMIGSVEDLVTISYGALGPYGRLLGYSLNSKGLRTPEYKLSREPGVRRIVLIGDSFLCIPGGLYDKKHIAYLLKSDLKAEVINLGIAATGPKYYQRMLEVEGLRLKPDCIAVFFFVGNDLTEEVEIGDEMALPDYMMAHSYLFRIFHNLSRLSVSDLQAEDDLRRPFRAGDPRIGGYFIGCPSCWPVCTQMEKSEFEKCQTDRAVIYINPWPQWLENHWGYLAETIKTMKRTAASAGIPILFILIPDETQVEAGIRKMVQGNSSDIALDFDYPQQRIKTLCAEAGIPFLDLLPSFRAAYSSGIPVYLVRDTHWAPEGQELAGRLVARKIREILQTR